VYFLLIVVNSVVSTSAINCLERLVLEVTDCFEWDVKLCVLAH